MEYEDALPGDSNSALHYPKASPRKLLRGIGAQAVTNRRRGEEMDNVTLIRVISGILAVVVLVILIYRMKKKAPK